MQGEAHGDVGVGVGRRLVGLLTCGSPGVLVGVGLGRPTGCRGLDGCVAVAVAVGVAVGCFRRGACVAVAVAVGVAIGCFRRGACVAVAVAVGVAIGCFRLGACVAVAVAVAIGWRLGACVAVAVAVAIGCLAGRSRGGGDWLLPTRRLRGCGRSRGGGGWRIRRLCRCGGGGWRLQVADFKVHRVGERDFLIRIGLGVGNGQFKGIGARLTLPFYAQRNLA